MGALRHFWRRKAQKELAKSIRPVAEALERRVLLTATLPNVPNWVEQGPGPITGSQPVIPPNNPAVGSVDAIVTVPGAANSNIAFIATVNGGVWRTMNLLSGATPAPTWTPLTDQMPSLSMGALALDPLDATNNTLYAATARISSGARNGGARLGIFVTTNALAAQPAWSAPAQHPEIFQDVDIVSLVPTAQMTTNGRVILLATNKGLWRSDNNGKNWLNLSHATNIAKYATGLPAGAAISELVADPSLNTRFFAAIPGQGVYVNTDNTGLKWAPVNNVALNAGNSVRIRLAMHSSGVLYAAVIDPGPPCGNPPAPCGQVLTAVFSSANRGTAWNNLGAPNPTVSAGAQGGVHLSIAADPAPANSNVVYVGGDRQSVSPFPGNLARYAGGVWTSIVSAGANGTAPHADSRVLAFANDNTLLDGDDGGIYRLVNPGNVAGQGTRQWQVLDNNLRATEFYSVAYDSNSHMIIGGAQDNGVSEQDANTNIAAGNYSWRNVRVGDGQIVGVDTTSVPGSSIRYSSTQNLGAKDFGKPATVAPSGFVRRTVNAAGVAGAATTLALNVSGTAQTLFQVDGNIQFTQPWVLSSTALSPSAACTGGMRPMLIGTLGNIYESCDGGDTLFQTALPALAGGPANSFEWYVSAMAYGGVNSPTGPNSALIYVAEDVAVPGKVIGTRLLRRDAAGGALNVPNITGYKGGSVKDIVVDPNNWNTVYLIGKSSVWRSNDKGNTFVNLSANLRNLSDDLRTIEFVDPTPGNPGDETILVGGDGGVFRRSVAAGARWTEFGQGMANALVTDLHYDATDNLLVAATFGRGAWMIPNVRANGGQKAVLNVTGSAAAETITLVREANNPLLLDVVIQLKNPSPSKITTFQLSTIDQISVKGGGGNDNLVIDERNGPIAAVIPSGISWDGTANTRSTTSSSTTIPTSSVADLEGGMQTTEDLASTVASNAGASTELPFVDVSASDVLTGAAVGAAVPGRNSAAGLAGTSDIGGLLKAGLFDGVTNYLGTDATPTVEELVGVLQGLSKNVGDLSFNIDPSTVFGGIFSTEDHDELKFDLVFQASRTVHAIPIKLGAAADSLGLHLDASATVDVTASMEFDFSFGVNLNPNVDARDAFFIQPHSLSFAADVHASAANFGVSIGFLKAGVQNGKIDLASSIQVQFKGFENSGPLHPGETELDGFSLPAPGQVAAQANAEAEAQNGGNGELTQSAMEGSAIGDLLADVRATGSLLATLPVVASLGGVVIPGTPTITVTDPDLFDGNLPQITTDADFDKLLDFDNVTPATILGLVDQFGNFLEQFRGSSVFATQVPFTNKTLGDLLDMRKAFLDKVGSVLEPQPGQPSFSTAQDLADKLSTALGLPPSAIAAKYDPATHELTYHVKLSDSLPAVSVPIAFNVNLGSLAGINTSSTISLSATAGLEFTFGINLAAPVATVTATADAPSNGKLSGAAHLSIAIGPDNPVDVTIAADATNAKLDDLIADINTALSAAGLGATVVAGKSGNKITLSTKGLMTSAAILVTAAAADPAVTDLHFATSKGATNTLAHQFFIKDASVNGSVTLSANDIDASARFGFLDVGVVNGHGTGTAAITAGLKDPGTVAADGKITLDELFAAVSGDATTIVSSPKVTGSANLVLPLTVTPNILGASAPANPTITVNWTDITDPSTLGFSYNGDMSQLLDFEHLSYLDIINALLSSVDFLSTVQQFSFLNQKLPLINKSVSELADSAQDLTQKIQAAEQNPAASLQTIATKLEQAMGLPAGSIKITLDGKAVRLDLVLQTGFQQNLSINLDLATLAAQAGGVANLQGVGNLIDVAGAAKLNVAADAKLNLAMGVDLTDPTSPKPFLYDSTAVALDAKASGSNLSFTASVGPLGLFINNGTANLDGDGNPATNDSATFTVGLIDDNGDGRHYFNELGTDDAKITLNGQVHATLPVFFPTSTQALGNLTLSIGKLSDISHTIQITAPNITAQFGLVDLLNNLGAIPDGLDKVLGNLQDAMDSNVFGSNLPLIGSHLKDGARFIEKIRTDAIQPLRDSLQDSPPIDVLKNALFDNLGPSGLNVLGDIDSNGTIDKSDVQVVVDPSGNQVQFNLLLRQQATLLNTPLKFDLGLPVLGLSVDGGVAVKVGYDFHFSFGVSKDDGFYFGTHATAQGTQTLIPELTVQLDAGIPDLQATGRLGFLQVNVQDDPNSPTKLHGQFDIDLKDPDNDGKLTFDELAAGPSANEIVDAKLNAQANVNLNLMATFGGSAVFPSVSADFALAWGFTNADTAAATGGFGDKPSIEFKNIRLNAGEFFSNFAKPILGKVQQILKPIEPLIDILTAPLPVLSDLPPARAVLDTDGDGSVSLAELAPLFSTDYDLSFLSSVAKTIKLINSIPTTGPNLFIDLGQFDIGSDARTDTQITDSDLTNVLQQDPESELSGQAQSFFSSLDDLNTVKGGGIAFPILQHPLDVFKLLLGQDINLFTYQMAPLMINFPMSEYFPIIGPLGVRLTGTVGASATFGFGYDTSGLREYFATPQSQRDPGQLFDGFYVSDRKNADGTGPDTPEVTLSAGIQASGELNLAAATAGVGGGIFATIDFNLNDTNNDGKVRFQELVDNFNRGPLCVFDLSGALFAGLNAYVTVLTFTETFNIATVKLLDFNFSCPAVAADPDPILATDLGGGVLRLNMGPNAGDRKYGDTKDEDENFKVTPGSNANSVMVQAYGFTQEYQNVGKIVGDGGAGNDTINIDSGVLAVVSLSGSVGDDTLLASTGPATLVGGAGNDQLRGGTGNDMLLGGDGDDTLLGGAGNDMLVAGTGVNLEILEGGDGNDTLIGSQTVDALSGGAGDDCLVGGDGKDNLDGGTGNDTLLGGNDDDAIQGGDGNDSIDGGAGNDSIRGNAGDDTIFGGAGNDTIDGANGNDQIFGQDGLDSITGGNGNDIISGGNDSDRIDAGVGNDLVTGDLGDDVIDAGADNDTVDGGDGNDTIIAGLGSDTVYGGLGADLIFAGLDATGGGAASDVNLIYGDVPNSILGDTDQIFGDIGNDTIFGGAADDTIQSLGGDDSVFGNDGNDSIIGGNGNDTISGGRGNDSLYGQAGDDAISGDDGADLITGDAGSDLLWGGVAQFDRTTFVAAGFAADGVTPNIVAGLSLDGSATDGKDTITGGVATDWLFGGGDSDLLLAGDGNDYADGGAGNDQANGQGGDDAVRGGGNDDTLHGGPDIDTLFGDDGNDQLFGDAGADDGTQAGQQLWGGAGNDALYAFAPSTDTTVEPNQIGDELHGGAGNDSLFGNLRQEKLFGDGGNDFIQGDGLAGSDYASNPQAALTGAADQIFGGTGEDQLFGGGGSDLIFGGADSDHLEGQNGADSLYGGSGIDAIVLDVDPAYATATDVVDGHFGNAAAGDTPDDNATDILLINGTPANDTILLSQAGIQLRVDYNGRVIFANWRDAAGKPLVEQFQINGLLGNDRIEFLSGANALDVSALSTRGTDWIGVLNGGPGNDTLIGSAGRDRIDGGRGSDSLLGLAGDDRLFGDGGVGQGDPTDFDQLFGGQGNDDLLGGQGTNQLYAWSHDPNPGGQFGVFVDAATGALHDNDGGGQFVLEDTGQNRMIGGPNADSLFGGTRLDFLYGNGGADQLFNRDGTPFTNLDSGLAGNEWKTYAQQTNKVWYVGGSNADDIITVDFVTEPGFLQAHHLVTRLTNNNGNFTFAAQVQLNFAARDNAGKPIWDPSDLVFDPATNQYTNLANFSTLLPPEGDFEAIIIDALAGNDQITVGPTVQKSVWIDGGTGDDQVTIKSGNPILPDQTEGASRNDSQQTARDLSADPNVGPIAGTTLLTGLTIDNPHDEDWYKIRFATAPQAGDSLTITGLAATDGLTVEFRTAASFLRTSVNGKLDLTGFATNTNFLLHITSNLVPTIYQLSFALAASPTQVTKNLAAPASLLRRDVIFGGDGNDTLAGGSGEDWIFGGDGNDVLTGGLDRQASDLLFGQAGDDTFQIIPDALPLIPGDTRTTVPTLTDQFDGGLGDDRVLFLGGDLDRNGKPVPDNVAIRYNTLLHRYEFASLIWDIANQEFMSDSSGTPLQDFSFYQASNIEHTVIDTRAGDDEIHADPGYVLGGSTWGIDPGDKQQGATIAGLDIRGGDGNDRLFGGAETDNIDGGPGVDFIAGGGGDDSITGGSGDDVLAGNTVIAPDRYESVTRNGVAGRNDDPSFATYLGDISPNEIIDNLSLHFGDAGDWYIIKTPDAFKRFANTQEAYLTPDKIDVRFGNTSSTNFFLFPAAQSNPNDPLSILPAERFAGVPDYYMLHVVNTSTNVGGLPAAMGNYQIRFSTDLGHTIDVSTTQRTLHINSSFPADAPAVIPLGDINGDGRADFVGAVQDYVGSLNDLQNPGNIAGYPGNPNDLLNPSFAKIYFGSASTSDHTFGTNDVSLKLPAPILAQSVFGSRSIISSPGDFNGDVIDDIAVIVTTDFRRSNIDAPFEAEGVYIIFGKAVGFSGNIDVVRDADVVIKGFNQNPSSFNIGDSLSIASAGDVNGDGIDDLLIGDDTAGVSAQGAAYLFLGRQNWSSLSQTQLLNADFETAGSPNLDGFTIDNTNSAVGGVPGLWHLTSTGLTTDPDHSTSASFYFGTGESQTKPGNYNVGQTAGRITSAAIDLHNISDATLSFNYFLSSERLPFNLNTPGTYDIARVLISKDGGAFQPLTVLDNGAPRDAGAANRFFGTGVALPDLLHDPTTGWTNATFDLGAYVGSTIQIRFDFASDNADNNFEGWYVDDVKVSAARLSIASASATFTGANANERFGSSVAGIGDFNGDAKSDFAILSRNDSKQGQVYLFNGRPTFASGIAANAATATLTRTTDFANFQVAPAGDIDGDHFDDLLITSNAESFLVFGRSSLTGTKALASLPTTLDVTATAPFVSLGDINGDSFDDLGEFALETSPNLAETGTVAHPAGQVFLGRSDAKAALTLTAPDLVFEPARPNYDSSAFRPYQFGPPGDINHDGKSDLALADAFGGTAHVYFGQALTAAQSQSSGGNGGVVLPAEPYVFQLTGASPSSPPSSPSGLDLTNSSSRQIRDAFALKGSATNDRLAGSQSVGDVNGDGVDDLIVSGNPFSYILFGPVNITGLQSAASRAEMIIDRTALGIPAGRMADLNGDGINDLIFIRSIATATPGVFDVIISVFFGGVTLQHNPTIASADRRITFVGGFSFDQLSPNQRLSSVALNFNGDKNADLLIVAAGLTGGPQAYMVSGKTIMNAPAGTLSIPTNASGSLFTIFGDQTARDQVQYDFFGPRFGGYDPSKTPNISASVPGDINGDGLEDVLFTDPGFSTPFHGQTIGRAYVFIGRRDSQLPPPPIPGVPPQYSLDQSNAIYQNPYFAAGASALGDINNDGYADFAISSSREDSLYSTASAFIFHGGTPSPTGVFRASQSAGLRINRAAVGSLNGISLNGQLSITAGDFDGDGLPELAIGEPQRIVEDSQDVILNADSRGSIYIFRTFTDPLFLSSANIILHGDSAFDKLGTLPATGPIDLNGDHTNDLLIGASQADLLAGSVISDAGKIYTIYGSRNPQTLPTGNAVLPLANETITGAGDFLVDPVTGQPVIFSDPNANSANYTLAANQAERWYQFTTLGDGLPGNEIRLTPGAQNFDSVLLSGHDGTLIPAASGYAVSTTGTTLLIGGQPAKIGIIELDLSQFLDEAFQPADIETALLFLEYKNASFTAGQSFRISLLNAKGDGIVSSSDATTPGTIVDQEIFTAAQLPSGVFSDIDLTDAVRAALQAGETRLTLRLETSSPQASLEVTRFGFGGGPFPTLNINTLQHPGVLADLYNVDGIVLAKGLSIIDLRPFAAGTFFLRVFNPFAPANQPMPFTIAISPPIAGSTHAQSDRDQIHGGDGNDTIAGNKNLDELFGDAGMDYFVADAVEVHDQQSGEATPTPPPASEASNIPLAVADPQITITDPGLRSAVADALAIGHTQLPAVELSQPIFASDLTHITRLNAAGLSIVDLTGLELLKNLIFLDLSNNNIATLASTDVNQLKRGLVNLKSIQYLDLDSNQLDDADLADIAKLSTLKALSIDYNDLRNVSPLAAMTSLQFLSLDARSNFISTLPGQKLGTDVLTKLANPTTAAGDQFGGAVATIGSNILIGDPQDDTAGSNAGAVYLFDGVTGALVRTFLPPSPAAGAQFGFSIAALGNNILIGAPFAKVGVTNNAGAAYLFDSQNGALLQTFSSPTPSSGDEFGWAVAALNGNAVIGAPQDEIGAGTNTGVVYLFDPATGMAIHTYVAPTPTSNDNFGLSVAAAGNNILVGAPTTKFGTVISAGAAYLLDGASNTILVGLHSSQPAVGEGYGNAVAGSADALFVGAPFHNSNAGAVYDYDVGGASLLRTIDNPNLNAPRTDDQFGSSLAVSGSKLLVGSPFDFPGGVDHAGNAFLFDISTGALLQTVVSPTPTQLDFLGTSVAFAGNNLLVGSPGNAGGTAYLVEGSRISDLGTISSLTNLNWLSISGNRIADASPLASMNNLRYLDLHANRIAAIAPLGSLTNLQRLLLNRNPLDNAAQSVIASQLATIIPDFSYDHDQVPVIQPIAPQATVVGTPVTVSYSATDLDAGDALFFTATTDNPNVSVAIQGNQLILTPPPAGSNFTGTVHITLTAFDGPSGPDDFRGRSISQTFDLSVGVAAIYGTKFNDLNGNGTRDGNEPGLPGWTIFLDTNQNGSLDPGEFSTTTNANGSYAFNNLASGSYVVTEVGQPGWFQTSPRNLLTANFTGGASGFVTSGASNQWHTSTRRSADAGHSSPSSFYFGSDATGAYSNNSSGTLTSPTVDLSNASGKILLNFNQFLSAIDTVSPLTTADFGLSGQPNANGYTRTGLFHLSTGRGTQLGHSATNSMYFGSGETAGGGGTYTANSTGTLTSPLINLVGITGPIQLSFNQLLAFPTVPLVPATGDAATVTVISGAFRTVIADNFGAKRNLVNTLGFQPKTLDLTAFAGQQIQVEFKFQADNDLLRAEGWYVDDISVSAPSVDIASVSIIANGNTTRIADNATLGNLLDSTAGFVPSSFDISLFAGKQIQIQFSFQSDGALTAEGWYLDDVTISAGDSRPIPLTVGHVSTANNLANFQILNLGPDRFVNEGDLVQLNANAADPNPAGSNFAYAWSVITSNGQVIPAGNSSGFSFTAADNGTYTVNLNVTGNNGINATDQLVVTANNVSPLTDLGPDVSIQDGTTFTRLGSFADPGTDTWTATVDYGDGTGPQLLTLNPNKTFTLSKLYSLPGVYTVAITVKDKDQAVGIDTMLVTVLPAVRLGTAGNDNYTLRLDPTGTITQFFLNVPTTGSPTFALPTAALGPLTFNMLAGDDTITIDFTNGNPVPASGITFDGGIGNDLLHIIGTSAADAISINAAQVTFSNAVISYSATEQITIDGGAGNDTLTVAAALPISPVFIGGPGNNTLNVNAGTYNLAIDGAGLNVVARNSAIVNFNASQHLTSLTLNDTSRANLASGGSKFIRTNGMTIGPNATFDLGDNDLVLQSSASNKTADLAILGNLIKSGRNNGLWNGKGLISSFAATQVNRLTGLAVAINDKGGGAPIYSSFDGEPVDVNSILVKYTWNGDADLSGKIDADDYFQIDSGYAQKLTGYRNGDFDFNGTVDADDYFLIDRAFAGQAGVLASSQPAASTIPAPLRLVAIRRAQRHHRRK